MHDTHMTIHDQGELDDRQLGSWCIQSLCYKNHVWNNLLRVCNIVKISF
jgi:hypothetical protein